MRRLIVLAGLVALSLAASVEAATLNKCIDAQGKVTYSNLPCHNAREARTLEIDPAPRAEPVRSTPVRAQPARPASQSAPSPDQTATTQLETQPTGKPAGLGLARQCDAITDKLGRVSDKMDQARRKGYTQKQMDEWNQEVKDLERKKQQAGCF